MASVLMATLVATGQQLHMAYLDWRIGALTQPEIRFAGIVVAFAFLLTKVVTPVSSRVVDSLVGIRRDFAFGRIGVQDAVQQADIAIQGARLSDVLQKDVAIYLSLLEESHIEIGKAEGKAAALRSTLESQPDTNERAVVEKAVRESIIDHLRSVKVKISAAGQQVVRIKQRVNFLTGLTSDEDADADALQRRMQDALASFESRLESFPVDLTPEIS